MIGSKRLICVVFFQRKPAYFINFTFINPHHPVYHDDKKQQENNQTNYRINLNIDDAFKRICDDFHKAVSYFSENIDSLESL